MSNAYARAGVDTQAGDLAVELMKDAVAATQGPAVLGGTGGFAGMYDLAEATSQMRRPLLATSTDGVGTKVDIARQLGIYDTIGFDLVGMVVDDLTPVGVHPLFMTDYIACGHVVPQRIADIVRGVAQACQAVDCALVAGETAEHPGLLGKDEFDIAGAATGVVDAPRQLGPDRVCVEDRIIGFASSGLHSNGYSLVRRILADNNWNWTDPVPADLVPPHDSPFLDRYRNGTYNLGLACLEPTRLYSRLCLELEQLGWEEAFRCGDFCGKLEGNRVHAFAHITGGGLAANLCRVIPAGLNAVVDRGSWPVPPLFRYLQQAGHIDDLSAEDTWNLGLGMVAVVHPDFVSAVEAAAKGFGIESYVIGRIRVEDPVEGRVVSGTKGVAAGSVTLQGSYRS